MGYRFFVALGVLLYANALSQVYVPNQPPSNYFERLLHDRFQNESFFPLTRLNDEISNEALTLIPDGRSLQRKSAGYEDPRTVESTIRMPWHTREDPSTPPMYIGFAPRANQLEILPPNDQGEYDFMVVEDYDENGKPIVKHANRGVCMTCHQHGGPIFSAGLWGETLINSKVRDETFAKYGANFHGVELDAFDVGGIVFGLDIDVRRSAKWLQSNRVCREACGDSLECRKHLLLSALLKPRLASDSTRRFKYAYELQKVFDQSWPKKEFKYRSSVLPNRDPTRSPERGGIITRLFISDINEFNRELGAFFPGKKIPPDLRDLKDGDEITFLEELSSSPIGGVQPKEYFADDPESLSDPTIPRPFVGRIPREEAAETIMDRIGDCFYFTADQRSRIAKFSSEEIESILNERNEGLFEPWPPSAELILARLEGRTDPELRTCDTQANTSPLTKEEETSVDQMEKAIDRDLNLSKDDRKAKSYLTKYCKECHRGEDAIVEFALDTPKEFRQEWGADAKGLLESGKMPPRIAEEKLPNEERSFLIDYLSRPK